MCFFFFEVIFIFLVMLISCCGVETLSEFFFYHGISQKRKRFPMHPFSAMGGRGEGDTACVELQWTPRCSKTSAERESSKSEGRCKVRRPFFSAAVMTSQRVSA